jgi:hypothetical protein
MRMKRFLTGIFLLAIGLILIITLIGAIIGIPLMLIGAFLSFYEVFIHPHLRGD